MRKITQTYAYDDTFFKQLSKIKESKEHIGVDEHHHGKIKDIKKEGDTIAVTFEVED